MRILQVSSARAFGGGERHLLDLSRSLAGRGHEVYAALAPDSPLRGPLLESHMLRDVFDVPLRNALDLRGATRLARIARDVRAEIIHAHVARDYTLASFAARRVPEVRLVITRHVLFPMSRVHRRALSNVSRVIAVSEAVARALRGKKIFDPDKIRVVANGVDYSRFVRARTDFQLESVKRGGARGRLRVGIVGELSEVKNQEDFVRAAPLLAEEFGDSVEFMVVGESARSDGYRERLESLIAELRLADSVRLLGRSEDVAPLIASMDVLVSASRTEAFGIVLVEAAACGIPVVATATEGAREIVEDGVTGTLVPVGDVRALASAVAALLRDAHMRLEFGMRARGRAHTLFSLERMAVETERVYAEAAASRT